MGFVLGYALGFATVPLWQRRAKIWAWLNSFGGKSSTDLPI